MSVLRGIVNLKDLGSVIVDAYRTYNTSFRTIMEGFVGSGDPELHFIFDEIKEVLHLMVLGECNATHMRETVRSMGHNLYLPFTKSLRGTEKTLRKICRDYDIDGRFRPTSYSDPESNVTGAVDVPEIIAKYGHVYAIAPSSYWDHKIHTTYCSEHPARRERLYVEWENPRRRHAKWREIIWMKDEFHYGFRCDGFKRAEEFDPHIDDAILDIRLPKTEVGRLSGLMTKMLEDYNRVGSEIKRRRGR